MHFSFIYNRRSFLSGVQNWRQLEKSTIVYPIGRRLVGNPPRGVRGEKIARCMASHGNITILNGLGCFTVSGLQ